MAGHPMTIRFDDDVHAPLHVARAVTGRSVNSIVNEAVRQYLARPEVVAAMERETERQAAAIRRLPGRAADENWSWT